MDFQVLDKQEQLEEIIRAPGNTLIFKHNTTCPISKGAKQKLESEAELLAKNSSLYILDLLACRDISNAIEERFDVKHQSPQLLLIKNGKCTFHQSLYDISPEEASEAAQES